MSSAPLRDVRPFARARQQECESGDKRLRLHPRALKVRFNLLQRFSFRFGQEPRGGDEIDNGTCRKPEEHGGVSVLADRGQKDCGDSRGNRLVNDQRDAHSVERMRVGINSESASHTQTPGPMAKNAMKTNSVMATIHPLRGSGTGVTSAFSIFSGASRARRDSRMDWRKTHYFVGRDTAFALDLNGLCRRIVRSHDLARRAKISIASRWTTSEKCAADRGTATLALKSLSASCGL